MIANTVYKTAHRLLHTAHSPLSTLLLQGKSGQLLRDGSKRDQFVCRKQESRDLKEVAQLFADSFTQREPMCKSLSWKEGEFAAIALDTCTRAQDKGLCLVIEDLTSKKLASFMISEDYNSPLYDAKELVEDHVTFAPIYALLASLHTQYRHILQKDGFCQEDIGDGRILHLAFGGTAVGYEGKGLLQWLTSEQLEFAINSGFEKAIGVNTSEVAKRNLQKFGFKAQTKIDYASFVWQGKHVFKDLAPAGNPFCVIQDRILK